jgi:DNA polymerase III alpha subunit|tara:strand:- start:371 stop:928 length:558 start_codon:yes stop_codon:yes gene_type:complete
MPDIDLDFADRTQALSKIKHVTARIKDRKHNTGVYAHRVPVDPYTGLCTLDHKTADETGYFKLDVLNVSIYKDVKDNEHLTQLMEREPLWQLLEHTDFSDKVFHLSGHSELLKQLKPHSVEQLASVLAMIRPAKRHLVNETWQTINEQVWKKPAGNEYYFKKSHAHSYAMACIVHINLICEQLGY